ncbi:MAG: hypothetical protein ABSC42_04585 [Tepidisphaeraceae bacterium]
MARVMAGELNLHASAILSLFEQRRDNGRWIDNKKCGFLCIYGREVNVLGGFLSRSGEKMGTI